MIRLLLLSLLLFGCTCASQPVVSAASSAAQPQQVVSYPLTPDDCYYSTGTISQFWPLLILQGREFYSFELPVSPWYYDHQLNPTTDALPQSLRIECPQFDVWAMLSDYGAETWEMQLLKRQEPYIAPLNADYRSEYDRTYLTLWPVDRPGACQVWADYRAPENYVYATVEPLGCDQIGEGAPFVITFHAVNLKYVSDFYVWWGIWAEDGGYGKLCAVDHPDYPLGLYDPGERRQDVADVEDWTDDSVYAQLGLDTAQYQRNMRTLLLIDVNQAKDGYRSKAVRYDHLRDTQHSTGFEGVVYCSGVATWQEEPVNFAGQSGALFNTVMMIPRSGNYVLYFQHSKPQYTHFIRNTRAEDAPTGPPVLFQVHETAG